MGGVHKSLMRKSVTTLLFFAFVKLYGFINIEDVCVKKKKALFWQNIYQ